MLCTGLAFREDVWKVLKSFRELQSKESGVGLHWEEETTSFSQGFTEAQSSVGSGFLASQTQVKRPLCYGPQWLGSLAIDKFFTVGRFFGSCTPFCCQ